MVQDCTVKFSGSPVRFALLGVLADALNVSIGLEVTSWLLLSIGTLLMGTAMFIGWAVGWYLRSSGK